MKVFRISLLLAASVLLLGAAAACSDDDDEDDGGEEPAATTPASDGGDGNAVTVEAQDFSFDPQTFTVTAGEEATVTLNNTGSASHTLNAYTDEEYTDAVDGADTGTISGGDTGEFTATFESGEYYFRCEIHKSQMQGTFDAE